MKLSAIFQKPVERPIEGVIKADDQTDLRVEIEEYVLTRELEKRLAAFLDAYNNYHGANGVWISGFFGSGKSHLLKMLSYLLESGTEDPYGIAHNFLAKCSDEILRAEIQRAVAIPSKSILFNIDQKADVVNKSDVDALLSVFLKVFNEMLGYFGKQPHVAQFERDLEDRGIYHDFQTAFEEIAGIPWWRGREQNILEGANIAAAYVRVTGSPPSEAEGILNKYRDSYRVSIEDFAELVNAYIQKQEPKFRLNFFVDEVGQFIADNIKLMTNLQTIAESLATKCGGRAWIIVTAQEDMDTVIGEMGAQQGNDFSKIQDRFKTRMKLTSQDVDEVIQKRLLAKNQAGIAELTRIYQQQVNNFKTLFDFSDGAQTYRNYRDQEHFIDAYPFIPYQFTLFQSAIQSLSAQNAFEGRHRSVGERSMLAVFQQVAQTIQEKDLGQLSTFDLMFEGIRNSLKANMQRPILNAEQNLDHPFAKRLLKALFLVKYVREFKATERNLVVLMTGHFGQDITKLRRELEEALAVLEQQTYIQRNGQIYAFLTDEEKDVEQEIKNTEVESSSVIDELGAIVFDRIIKETKIGAEASPYYYAFTRKIDDRLFSKGKTYELAIHLITPFNEHASQLGTLRAQSMGRDELVIVMPPDDRLMRDLQLFIQTNKYVNQNINLAQNESVKRILTNKQTQNSERYRALEEQARSLLGSATLIINGSDLDINGADAQLRVIRGFHQLIRSVYTNLKMLPNTVYKETDVATYLKYQDGLFNDDVNALSEPERELFSQIRLQKNNGMRFTLQALIEHFERKPYGWYLAAILCTVAKLYARGLIEVSQDGNSLEGSALEQALRNTHQHSNLVLRPQETFTERQIRALKDFFNEYFDQPAPDQPKELAEQTKIELSDQFKKLSDMLSQRDQYPFLAALTPVLGQLQSVIGKSNTWYLTDFEEAGAQLVDDKHDVIDPLRGFWNGGQRAIYDAARDFLKDQQVNFQSVGYDTALEIRQIIEDPNCFRGDHMRRAKQLMDGLNVQIDQALQAAKAQARAKIDALQGKLESDANFQQLAPLQREHLLESFRDLRHKIDGHTVIAVIEGESHRFSEGTFTDLLDQMARWLNEAHGNAAVSAPQYIPRGEIQVTFDKLSLDDEGDLDAYLARLRAAWLAQIRAGKRIRL